MTNSSNGSTASATRTKGMTFVNMAAVETRLGVSDTAIRARIDREQANELDERGYPVLPIKFVTTYIGGNPLHFITNGQMIPLTHPDGMAIIDPETGQMAIDTSDSVGQFIEWSKAGVYDTRTAEPRIVLYNSNKAIGQTGLTPMEAIAVFPPVSTVDANGNDVPATVAGYLEIFCKANGLTFRAEESKAKAKSADAPAADATSAQDVEAAAKLTREQQANAERDAAREAANVK